MIFILFSPFDRDRAMQICESITVYLTKYSDKKISQQPAGNFIFETAYTYTHSVHLLCNLHEFMI